MYPVHRGSNEYKERRKRFLAGLATRLGPEAAQVIEEALTPKRKPKPPESQAQPDARKATAT